MSLLDRPPRLWNRSIIFCNGHAPFKWPARVRDIHPARTRLHAHYSCMCFDAKRKKEKRNEARDSHRAPPPSLTAIEDEKLEEDVEINARLSTACLAIPPVVERRRSLLVSHEIKE